MTPVDAARLFAHHPPPDLLLIDDDPTDVEFAALLLAEQPHPYTLTPVDSAHAALAYLEGCTALPDLILLDLELPGMDGFALLEQLKTHPVWRAIPVVVLTVSTHPDHVQRAYEAHASGYLVKQNHLEVMRAQWSALLNFWRFVSRPYRPGRPNVAQPSRPS